VAPAVFARTNPAFPAELYKFCDLPPIPPLVIFSISVGELSNRKKLRTYHLHF
jgi:hypothetical protein